MGLFGDSRPRITSDEFHKKIRPALYNHGLKDEKLDRLEGFFAGYLNRPPGGRERGIYKDELETVLSYLKAHGEAVHLEPFQLELIDSELRKYL